MKSKTDISLALSNRTIYSANAIPGKPSNLSLVLTFCWRAILKIKHVPEQLIDVTASPVIFLLLFTYLFGGALAGSTQEYLNFVLPGIMAMTVIMITIYTGVGINNDIKKGIFDRFRSMPIWRPSVIIGGLLADTARYALAAMVMIVLGVILGYRPESDFLGLILGVLLLMVFASCLSWIWICLGLLMRTPESLMAVSMLILYPLTFASNVFVMPQTMPPWLETFVNINPITHLVTAIRGLAAGTNPSTEIGWVILTSAILLVIFLPLAMYIFRKK